ncbi:hypothetical protein KKD57_01515 [Patescibacteria group bacterium]|nr:hypothetical protein [Patescibacteria group bacterium]
MNHKPLTEFLCYSKKIQSERYKIKYSRKIRSKIISAILDLNKSLENFEGIISMPAEKLINVFIAPKFFNKRYALS